MRRGERISVVGVFVGKDERPEQKPLQILRGLQGWVVAESPDDPLYIAAKPRFRNAYVKINGSGAGACVAFAAEDALKEGALLVEVDFEHVMTSNEGADPILTRARHFFE